MLNLSTSVPVAPKDGTSAAPSFASASIAAPSSSDGTDSGEGPSGVPAALEDIFGGAAHPFVCLFHVLFKTLAVLT